MKRQDEMNEGKVVEAFYSDEEVESFSELESLIAGARPEFGKEWEERLVDTLSSGRRKSFFYVRSLAAASLLVAAVSFSLLLVGGRSAVGPAAGGKTVSAALVSDLVSSMDGKLDADFDDLFSAAEEKFNAGSSSTETYIMEVVGGNDENDIS